MHIAVILIVTFLIILLITRVIRFFGPQIKFCTEGIDQKFSFSEILTLWKLAQMCDLEEPVTLYYSVPSLSRCITHIIEDSQAKGTQDSPKVQEFLSKLYKYRTRIELDADQKKGLDSTKRLDKGQKLRIILSGKGLFESEILNNGRDLIIKLPTQKGVLKLKGDDWIDQEINVYLWRKGDANYVFDSRVLSSGVFNGQSALYITHSEKMLRAQKRRSVRCECHVPAQLYIIKEKIINYSTIETAPGYRCVLEDISEDGAMIRIGGKGVANINIKLQFELENSLIIIFGTIKAVEYNASINQSRLHFECVHVDPAMKNFILSFVYKVIPEKQKEILDALKETENDAKAVGDNITDENVSSEKQDSLNNSETINNDATSNVNDVSDKSDLDFSIPEDV